MEAGRLYLHAGHAATSWAVSRRSEGRCVRAEFALANQLGRTSSRGQSIQSTMSPFEWASGLQAAGSCVRELIRAVNALDDIKKRA